MSAKFIIKQGMTFIFSAQYADENNAPKPLTGITLTSQIRDRNSFVAEIDVNIIDANAGTVEFTFNGSTIQWPPGMLYWDVRIFENSIYTATETVPFMVERGVTLI
jgi:hypothetical protein